MIRRTWCLAVVVLAAAMLAAQQDPSPPKQQPIPDAPSTSQKPQGLPQTLPPGSPPTSDPQAPPPPAKSAEPATSSSQPPPAQPSAAPPVSEPAPSPPRPAQAATPGDNTRDEFTIRSNVNFVVVPVTVKDENGRLVDGLLRKDFVVYEDGVPQPIQLFTSDPFPLSAAVVIDVGMSDIALKKVQDSLSALAGAFSQFDELALYTFSASVQRINDFTGAEDKIAAALRRVYYTSGDEVARRTGSSGVPFAGGPFNTTGPVINGKQVDPSAPVVAVPRPESHVLNDAILAAAQDLAKRDRARRRMLFVISDGLERGSNASYADVMKVLLTNEVSVYALAVGNAAIPGYAQAQRFRIPGLAPGNILPKYASATGSGEVITELTARGIEQAYSRATEQARNQYTIGYTTRATAAGTYRTIEVRVRRPHLRIYAKDGYYPLPPQRTPPPPPGPGE